MMLADSRLRYWLGELVRSMVDVSVLRLAVRSARSAPLRSERQRILVLRNNDIGDVLIVTPLFKALRQQFPSARITAAVTSSCSGCLDYNPYVSEVIKLDAPWFNKHAYSSMPWEALRWILGRDGAARLSAAGYDVGIDVLGSTWGSLLLVLAGIPERLGTRGYSGGGRGYTGSLPFDPTLHVGRAALRFAELLGATGLPENRPQVFLSVDEREAGEATWRQMAGTGRQDRRRILVGPGAGTAARAWPAVLFQELVSRLAADKRLVIAVIGGPGEDEKRLVGRVAGNYPTVHPFPGNLELRKTFATVAAADLVVCNSSMLMHVAAAFRRPAVVVLGESFPSAEEHHAQWGYEQGCFSLGREVSRGQPIASPHEVAEFVARLLPQLNQLG